MNKGYRMNFGRDFIQGIAFLFLFFLLGSHFSYAEARWEKEGQNWYYYSSDEKEAFTGWVQSSVDGRWYFCLNNKMQTGWMSWNGKWYFLNTDGSMAENHVVGNFYVGEDGAVLISGQTPEGRRTSENGSFLLKGKPMQELNEKTARYVNVLMEHPDAKVYFDSPNQLTLEGGNGYSFVIFKKMSLYDRKSGELLYVGDAAFHNNAVIEYKSGQEKKLISVMDLMMIRGVAGERVFIDPAGFITFVSGGVE